MKERFIYSSILAVGLIIVLVFVLSSFGVLDAQVKESQNVKLFSGGLVTLIITFLVLDRWRWNEKQIESLRTAQSQIAKDLRESTSERVESYLKEKSKKIEALDNRVSSIIEEHPWIQVVTENELIPDVPSCRIILKTASDFLNEGKAALVYEYLFSYLDDKRVRKINGTVDDFLDIVQFCEEALQDDFLGLEFMKKANQSLGISIITMPHYLERLVRCNLYYDAKKCAERLKRSLIPSWWQEIFQGAEKHALSRRPSFLYSGLLSLALFEALNGKKKKSNEYINRAKELSTKLGKTSKLDPIRKG